LLNKYKKSKYSHPGKTKQCGHRLVPKNNKSNGFYQQCDNTNEKQITILTVMVICKIRDHKSRHEPAGKITERYTKKIDQVQAIAAI